MLTLEEVLAVVAEEAGQADRDARFPVRSLEALRSSGLLGLVVPGEFGGMGGGYAEVVDVTQRLAREDMSVAMVFAMHCQQAATLVRHAGPALRDSVLPALGRGELYLGSVTTERGKGGHLLVSESATTGDDEVLRVDRDAPIVTGGEHADAYLITALAPDATSPSQVSLVYARRDQLDVSVLGGWDPLGMRATHSVPMRLTGAVPVTQVVGERGGFRDIVTATFGPLAHLGWAAAWLGAAAGALSRVVGHIRSPEGRKQFDTESDLLLTRLASVRGRLEVVNALLRQTLHAVAGSADLSAPPVRMLVNTLKVQAARQCFQAVDQLVEVVGLRHGYLRGSALGLERVFRDLRSASLNYADDRLRLANGVAVLLDPEVRLA
ncbi:acyl-CoA dehydrogenase family protein [Saccharothrix variisporea]|uniref:Acyl-CoA dehydrogenase n=1 Tax=Saccharothrix variisporea TaxID=543527 RepID=A0A495XIT8_9PSEU|nr:acyl-CoA dehydrogenase family protein [Saccharothrix variisporea]RKT74290.1 acyl-CoA dehydrogenase [Saccharothrix variisporea]